MNNEEQPSDQPLEARLADIDRRIRRDRLREQILEFGGHLGGADGETVSEDEIAFLERVLLWETGPRATHRVWLERHGQVFMPPSELTGKRLKVELWRLLQALADARVFFYHTNHLDEAGLYGRLWAEVLPAESPDSARTRDDAWHWDFADAGAGEETIWLQYYASPAERREWAQNFPETCLPPRRRPRFRRDHRLPIRD